MKRFKMVRRSLLKIKTNTVTGMVHLFTASKKSIATESTSTNERMTKKSKIPLVESEPDKANSLETSNSQSPIKNYIAYFNELSENAVNENVSRRRAQSCNAKTISKQTSIIAKYKEYPKFKWSYLKYFGVDPRKYLLSHGVDLASAGFYKHIPTDSNAQSNRGIDNDFSKIRKRSQSCNVKTVSKPTNIVTKYREYPHFKLSYLKYFGVDPTHYLASCANRDNRSVNELKVSKTQNLLLGKMAGNSYRPPNVDRTTQFSSLDSLVGKGKLFRFSFSMF